MSTSTPTAGLAIDVSGLAKTYGSVTVLNRVELRVAPGTIYALLGPNGAGKTTLVRILATLSRADAGLVRVAGFDVQRERRQVRHNISLTGQYAALDDAQTGAENLQMIGRLAGLSASGARQRATELLEQFDLTEAANRRVATYSGGMRRRLDLALSLVRRPAVIFLDEPTTGLDPRSRQAMWRVIADMAADGACVLLTTQYLEEADQLASGISVLDGGRIIARGTPDELKQRVAEQRLDLAMADAGAFQHVAAALGSRASQRDANQLTIGIPTDGSAAHMRALLDELDPTRTLIQRCSPHSATLDDVFFALTGHAASSTETESTDVKYV